jgi:hypothetical protein
LKFDQVYCWQSLGPSANTFHPLVVAVDFPESYFILVVSAILLSVGHELAIGLSALIHVILAALGIQT